MSTGESTIKTAEMTSSKPSGLSQAHKQVFGDAKDFLSVLQSNYFTLSHFEDKLSLPNLQLDASDTTLPTDVREAASIAARHYTGLQKMAGENNSLDFFGIATVSDKVNGTNVAREKSDMGKLAVTGAAVLGAGLAIGGVAALAGEAVVLGAGGVAVGVAGIGAYLLYEGVKGEWKSESESHAASSTINQWIR